MTALESDAPFGTRPVRTMDHLDHASPDRHGDREGARTDLPQALYKPQPVPPEA